MKIIKLLTLLSFLSLSVQAQEKSIEKSFSGVKSIRLSVASGDVFVEKGSNTVEVKVNHDYDDDEVEFVFDQSGSRLEMKEDFSNSRRSSGFSKWYLSIPDGLDVQFNSGSGDVKVEDIDIELKVNSGSGDFSGDEVKGEVSVNIGSGDISFVDCVADLTSNSGSGDVQVDRYNGELTANVGSGDVNVGSATGAFSVNAGSGELEIRGIEITDKSSFNAGSGDVEIELSKALDHDISVNSGSGDAVLDFNGNEIAGEITMTVKKNGGDIIAPFDFDTSEEIDEGKNTKIRKTAKIGSKDIEIKISSGSGDAVIKK